MAEMTLNDIPKQDLSHIKERLISQIAAMDEAELKIVTRSEQSLAYYIAEAFRSIAKLLGYMIALPIAFAFKVVEGIGEGFKEGWDAAFKNAGID